jgi:DNA-binding response OmpR family regulator
MLKEKILVIEDDQYVRENIVIILTEEGYDVKMAENGLIGIKMIRSESFDLIICDILMPHLDGFEVLKFIKSKDNTASIPFLFLTAKVEQNTINQAFAMGATNYLLKPFQIDDLLASIENVIKKSGINKSQS